MSYIKKPRILHPQLAPNGIGLSIHDYEGAMSTLCAGCGHDSVSAAIIQAFFELDVEPHRVAKLSGIGCPRLPLAPMLPTGSCITSAFPAMEIPCPLGLASCVTRFVATSTCCM